MGRAHRAEIRKSGAGIGDDEHVAGLAPAVGVLRGSAVQVLDVVAQAFLGQQPGDEGEFALAAEHSRSECGRHDGLVAVQGSPRSGAVQMSRALNRPRVAKL